MITKQLEERARQLARLAVRGLVWTGITPNMLSFTGLFLTILTALIIADGQFVVAGFMSLFAGLFDLLDGALAKVSKMESKFGAFFDSTLDRYSEAITYAGFLYYFRDYTGSSFPLFNQGGMLLLIYMIVLGSFMVSYARARAEGLGLECKIGFLARPDRVVLISVALVFSFVTIWTLYLTFILLAVGTNFTAIQRIVYIYRTTKGTGVTLPLEEARLNKGETDVASTQAVAPLPEAEAARSQGDKSVPPADKPKAKKPKVFQLP